MRVLDAADLLVYLADASVGIGSDDASFVQKNDERTIRVWSKCDLTSESPPAGWMPLSTVTGWGFTDLENRVAERLDRYHYGGDEVLIDSARQRDLLEAARRSLILAAQGVDAGTPLDAVATDFQDALRSLGEITGEVTTADILERMFSDFCVGK
jgi:tRNA modification GTPase